MLSCPWLGFGFLITVNWFRIACCWFQIRLCLVRYRSCAVKNHWVHIVWSSFKISIFSISVSGQRSIYTIKFFECMCVQNRCCALLHVVESCFLNLICNRVCLWFLKLSKPSCSFWESSFLIYWKLWLHVLIKIELSSKPVLREIGLLMIWKSSDNLISLLTYIPGIEFKICSKLSCALVSLLINGYWSSGFLIAGGMCSSIVRDQSCLSCPI